MRPAARPHCRSRFAGRLPAAACPVERKKAASSEQKERRLFHDRVVYRLHDVLSGDLDFLRLEFRFPIGAYRRIWSNDPLDRLPYALTELEITPDVRSAGGSAASSANARDAPLKADRRNGIAAAANSTSRRLSQSGSWSVARYERPPADERYRRHHSSTRSGRSKEVSSIADSKAVASRIDRTKANAFLVDHQTGRRSDPTRRCQTMSIGSQDRGRVG